MSPKLRPIERVIVRLNDEDVTTAEIARRIGKRPGTVGRIMEMIHFKQGSTGDREETRGGLRPIEKVVLRLRAQGESYGLIGNRLGRSGAHIRRIESYAQFKS